MIKVIENLIFACFLACKRANKISSFGFASVFVRTECMIDVLIYMQHRNFDLCSSKAIGLIFSFSATQI
jgi:hypothetical protein